jgi:hypothetical protein
VTVTSGDADLYAAGEDARDIGDGALHALEEVGLLAPLPMGQPYRAGWILGPLPGGQWVMVGRTPHTTQGSVVSLEGGAGTSTPTAVSTCSFLPIIDDFTEEGQRSEPDVSVQEGGHLFGRGRKPWTLRHPTPIEGRKRRGMKRSGPV